VDSKNVKRPPDIDGGKRLFTWADVSQISDVNYFKIIPYV